MRNWTEHGSSQLTAISDAGSTPAASTNFFKQQRDQGPSLRSGFRLRAQTPATRLKFDSPPPPPTSSSRRGIKVLRCAEDFACGLRRPQRGSSSTPAASTTFAQRATARRAKLLRRAGKSSSRATLLRRPSQFPFQRCRVGCGKNKTLSTRYQ
jgi:hypothetical protein